MVCIVFPSPISSAKIPFIFILCNFRSQFNPSSWYSFNSPFFKFDGCCSCFTKSSSVSESELFSSKLEWQRTEVPIDFWTNDTFVFDLLLFYRKNIYNNIINEIFFNYNIIKNK